MTENSKEYTMYCDLITDIYTNIDDKDEAENVIRKFSDFVKLLEETPQSCKSANSADGDFIYFVTKESV